MTLDDLPRVVELDRASFSLPWPESSFRFEISENKVSRCWVAETPGEDGTPMIAAMIVIWLIIDEVDVATFAVDGSFRRQGIAQRLLAHALLDAGRDGGKKAFLEVRASNTPARSLYHKFGFIEDGVRKQYYADNHEDAILMVLDPLQIDVLESFL